MDENRTDDPRMTTRNLPRPDYLIPGIKVVLFPQPVEWELVVISDKPCGNWVPFRDEKYLARREPPTTFEYKGRYYYIYEVVEGAGGWEYKMNPAPSGDTIFSHVVLSPEFLIRSRLDEEESRCFNRKIKLAVWYDFLLGWLPARHQIALSKRLMFSTEDASRKNALLQFLIFFPLTCLGLATQFAGYGSSFAFFGGGYSVLVLFYLSLEGYARWNHVKYAEITFGFSLFELLDWLAVKIRKRFIE